MGREQHKSQGPPRITPDVLEAAYREGVFPMGDPETGEIHWYRPEPRAIFDIENFHVPRRLAKTLRSGKFTFTIDQAFRRVMEHCARRDQDPAQIWITDDIVELYGQWHAAGKAHSVEAWREGELAGGLYGVALGGAFMGESMFSLHRDASKAALVFLVRHLRRRGYVLLDTQFATEHLAQFGLLLIPHQEYLRRLTQALALKEIRFADKRKEA